MKSNYKLMLTAVGAFALGALAIQGLHAQMKPPAYFIGEISVKDENNYTSEFLPLARKSIAEGGGKYVAGGFHKTVAFSGEPPPNRVVIIHFENMDKAKAWYDSPAYREAREHHSSELPRRSWPLALPGACGCWPAAAPGGHGWRLRRAIAMGSVAGARSRRQASATR